MDEKKYNARVRTKAIAAEFAARGDTSGWFDALYRESDGNTDAIPWADLEPNEYLQKWAETNGLEGEGRSALVVGSGLGDDAKFLYDRGFKVTGFDISPTAIEWAKRLHADTDIQFETADLLGAKPEWKHHFDFVLEVYTIQPLPLAIRPKVIDAIASFVAPGGQLLVVTRGRGDQDEPDELPWGVSRQDLKGFEANGLAERSFIEMDGHEDEPSRFVVQYLRV
ncbi:MAG: class I SAM-dependent methyltransferase [Acidobacteriota bacterium]